MTMQLKDPNSKCIFFSFSKDFLFPTEDTRLCLSYNTYNHTSTYIYNSMLSLGSKLQYQLVTGALVHFHNLSMFKMVEVIPLPSLCGMLPTSSDDFSENP